MAEYLIFIQKINNNVYQVDFSEDKETAWGDGWENAPAGNNPHLCPERNAISSSYRIETDLKLNTACSNTCFSMQDCIDGIIAVAFTDPGDKNKVILPFGMGYNDTWDILRSHCSNITELQLDGDNVITDLIKDLDATNDE